MKTKDEIRICLELIIASLDGESPFTPWTAVIPPEVIDRARKALAEDVRQATEERKTRMKTPASIRREMARAQQPPQQALQSRRGGPIPPVFIRPPVEDMDLIALAHMPVEEAATVLLQKHSVSAGEFRVFWELVEPVEEETQLESVRCEEEVGRALDAQEDAELEALRLLKKLAAEKEKNSALEVDVANLEADLARGKHLASVLPEAR